MRHSLASVLRGAAIVAACAVACPTAHAQWSPSGVLLCGSPGFQDYPVAVPDGSGGAFVVWRDFRADPDGDLYLHYVTASGFLAPGWPQSGLPLAVVPKTQGSFAIIADGTGAAIIVWQDNRDYFTTGWDIYAQRVLGNGELAPGWPPNGLSVSRAPEDQTVPVVVADGLGGAIVAWTDFRDGSGYFFVNPDVYAVRITAGGAVAPGWQADGTSVANTLGTYELDPYLIASGTDGVIVEFNIEGDLYAKRMTGEGMDDAAWPAGGVVLSAALGGQGVRGVCSDGAGGAFVAWDDVRSYPGFGPTFPWQDIYAQHVTAGGQVPLGWPADGLPVCVGFEGQVGARIVPDGQGGFVAAWNDYRAYEGEIFALRMTGSGAIAPGWPAGGRRVADPSGAEFSEAIASDGLGGAYIAFENWAPNGSKKILAQHLTGTGSIAPGWSERGTPVSTTPQAEFLPSLATSGSGAIVAWTGGLGYDIYAQKLVTDGPVPVQVSLVSAEATPEEVVLRWYAASGLRAAIAVWRRSITEEWHSLGTVFADGGGHIEYRDRAVIPGMRYAYRLRYSEAGSEETTPEVWVDAPAAFVLRLEGFRPNPCGGTPSVWFTLATGAQATLDLFEVSGRRLMSREVGSMGGGLHTLSLGDQGLRPGIYWLRLRQGPQTLVRSAVVVS